VRALAQLLSFHFALSLAACASTASRADAGGDTPPGPVWPDVVSSEQSGQGSCSAQGCPSGATCCLLTGDCYRVEEEAARCPRPPPDADPRRTCSSIAQCAAGELCFGDSPFLCLGPGHCQPRSNCGICSGSCGACGCDGRAYPSPQAACLAGVRTTGSGSGACGIGLSSDGGGTARARIPCGSDTQCPADQRCCPVTGTCTDRSCPACCRVPPPGTSFPCVTNDQCQSGEYCVGEGCGTPGGCRATENRSRCTGESDPVCGCDGRNYLNNCWAAVSGSRVATPAMCPR